MDQVTNYQAGGHSMTDTAATVEPVDLGCVESHSDKGSSSSIDGTISIFKTYENSRFCEQNLTWLSAIDDDASCADL